MQRLGCVAEVFCPWSKAVEPKSFVRERGAGRALLPELCC